jgi:hypothetical protein
MEITKNDFMLEETNGEVVDDKTGRTGNNQGEDSFRFYSL